MNYPHPARQRDRRSPFCQGFSLVEVVVAVGIASTVLVALIGLLSFGMTSMRDSEETTTEAQLVERLFSELQGQQDWGRLSSKTLYFDNEGEPVRSIADSDFTVRIEPEQRDGVSLPGSLPNPYLRYVTLKIGFRPGGYDDFSDQAREQRKFNQYSTLIADMTRDSGLAEAE